MNNAGVGTTSNIWIQQFDRLVDPQQYRWTKTKKDKIVGVVNRFITIARAREEEKGNTGVEVRSGIQHPERTAPPIRKS